MHTMTYDHTTQLWYITVQVQHSELVADTLGGKDVSGYGLVRQLLTMSPDTLRQPVVMEMEEQRQHVRAVDSIWASEDDGTAWPCVVIK